jgi:hypothetical protein
MRIISIHLLRFECFHPSLSFPRARTGFKTFVGLQIVTLCIVEILITDVDGGDGHRYTERKHPTAPIGVEADWTSEPLWTLWRKVKHLSPAWHRTTMFCCPSHGLVVIPTTENQVNPN